MGEAYIKKKKSNLPYNLHSKDAFDSHKTPHYVGSKLDYSFHEAGKNDSVRRGDIFSVFRTAGRPIMSPLR